MSDTKTLPAEDSKTSIPVVDGKMSYSTAAESGHVEIMIPSLPGSPRETETLHARNLGQHIIGKMEASLNHQGYIITGPTQTPAEVLKHYAAVSRGAGLMDSAAQGRLDEIAGHFAEEPNQERYYKTVVKPYLGALTPHRRR